MGGGCEHDKRLAFATDTSCDVHPRSTLAVVPDTWTHVAVTVDSASEEVAFYVDRRRRRRRHRKRHRRRRRRRGAARARDEPFVRRHDELDIRPIKRVRVIHWLIDNVRLWNVTLLDWQVARTQHAPSLPKDPVVQSLLANFSFDITIDDTHNRMHNLTALVDDFPFSFVDRVQLDPEAYADPAPAAVQFSSNTTVVIPLADAAAFAPKSLTFEAWVKPDNDTSAFRRLHRVPRSRGVALGHDVQHLGFVAGIL